MLLFGPDWWSRLSKCEKAFWILISLASLSALIYEWSLIIRGFVDDPIRSNVLYKEPKRMRFPPLLFCQNQYYFNETQIGGNLNEQPGLNVAKYMRIVTNPTGADTASLHLFNSEQDQNKAQQDYLAYIAKYQNNPWAAFERLMFTCQATVRQCSLGSRNYTDLECCHQFAVHRLTPVGPCLAFQPPDQEIPSSNGAFQIDFDLPAIAYNFAPNFGGFDLYLGDMIGKPMTAALTLTDEDSYTVQLSSTTYENNIDRDCNRALKPVFSQFSLIGMDQSMRCAASAVRKLCQCDPVFKIQLDAVPYLESNTYHPAINNGIESGSSYQVPQGTYQFCDLQNVLKCAVPLLNSTRDQSNFTAQSQRLLGHVPCDARPPCVDNRYHFAVTEFREMTPTSSNYRSRLRLYYESFVLTEIDQRQAYNFHHVVVNMGGSLTFWFIAVHILAYFVSIIKHCCCDQKIDHNHANGVSRNKVADIEANMEPNSKSIVHPITKSVAPVEPNGDTVEELK